MKTEKSLQVQTASEFPKTISAKITEWQRACGVAAADQVKLVNDGRTIGLLLQEWCGRAQLSLTFFETHKRQLPKLASWSMLRNFIAIAGKLPSPATNLGTAKRALQAVFEAGGFLEIPERQVQNASQRTKFMELVAAIARLRGVIAGWLQESPLADWDPEQRADVKSQMQPLVEDFYEKLSPTMPPAPADTITGPRR